MDNNREHQTVFRWRRASQGYHLASGQIVRRGGQMIEYDPASVTPGLHHIFANIMGQSRAIAANEGRKLTDDPSAPFHVRAFDDVPSAMVAFVNEFGFLGSDRTGADAESEELAYLYKLASQLRELQGYVRLQQSTGPMQKAFADAGIKALVDVRVREDGPNLRMVIVRNSRSGEMQVRYEPESLYAWMWMRTAEDFTNGVDWSGSPCLYCLEPIGRGFGGARRHAKFCSSNHRSYFNRLSPSEQQQRMKEAAELTRGAIDNNQGSI